MQHILVIKHGALGDIIQAIDAFESLRLSFPEAHITLLTGQRFAPLLAASGWFDEVVSDPRKPIWHLSHSLRLARLFSQPFEAILDLQCSSRTATYFKLMRPKGRWFGTVAGLARRAIGYFGNPDIKQCYWDINSNPALIALSSNTLLIVKSEQIMSPEDFRKCEKCVFYKKGPRQGHKQKRQTVDFQKNKKRRVTNTNDKQSFYKQIIYNAKHGK